MTNGEAIDLLDNLIGMIEDNHNSDYDMALKMGIKALKKQSTTKNDLEVDCIRRQAVERIINKWLSHSDYELKDHIYSMTEKIHNLPSVTPLSSGLEKNSKKLEKDDELYPELTKSKQPKNQEDTYF